jgi:large subunit ribosomal protein L37Ae
MSSPRSQTWGLLNEWTWATKRRRQEYKLSYLLALGNQDGRWTAGIGSEPLTKASILTWVFSYGASLRKQVKKMEITQHAKYTCTFCGKVTVRRHSTGIWNCKACKRTIAGGAYTVATPAAAAMRSTLRRLREIAEV